MRYILFFFLIIPGTFKAQPLFLSDAARDSLEVLIQSLPEDTNRVNTLVKLSNIYTTLNPDRAKRYAQEGLDLAQQLDFKKGEILGFSSLSFLYSITGEWARGIDMAFKGLELAHGYDPGLELFAINNLALGFQKQGDYKKSLEWSFRSIEHNRVHKILSDIDHWPAYHGIGFNYSNLGILDSALLYAKKGLEIARQNVDQNLFGFSSADIGIAYSNLKNYDSAVVYLKTARDIMQRVNNDFGYQEFNRDLAKLYFAMDNPDSAQHYAFIAYTEASKINNPLVVQDASFILSRLFEKSDLQKAHDYLKTYNRLKDSLSTHDKAQQVQQAEFNEQKKLVDLQAAQLKARNQIKQNALWGSLTTLLLIALILWYTNRRTQKINELLKKQKQEIEYQRDQLKATQDQLVQSEKMASLGELTAGIAHEIQNPLNFVNNFSEVNTELLTELEDELKDNSSGPLPVDNLILLLQDIKDNELKINYHGRRADSIVKGMLQHSRKGAGVKEPTDINALCDEYLRLAYHGYKAKDKTFNVDFETHFDPSLPYLNVVTQDFGRVVLNIINNAFYALSSKASASLAKEESSVSLAKEESSVSLAKEESSVSLAKEQSSVSLPKEEYSFAEASEDKPKVTITTKYFDSNSGQKVNSITIPYVQINISDNGPGVPAHLKDKIFQPFFTTKPSGSGTGLGLSLAYEIVTNGHRGELVLESEEGKGSTFIIRIPVEQ